MNHPTIDTTTLAGKTYYKILRKNNVYWKPTQPADAPWMAQAISTTGGSTFLRVDNKDTQTRLDKILHDANKSA